MTIFNTRFAIGNLPTMYYIIAGINFKKINTHYMCFVSLLKISKQLRNCRYEEKLFLCHMNSSSPRQSNKLLNFNPISFQSRQNMEFI